MLSKCLQNKRFVNVVKFEDYKGKVKEMVEKRDYVSNSEHSDNSLDFDKNNSGAKGDA